MTQRERLLFDTKKNIMHVSDMLCYEAKSLKRIAGSPESDRNFRFSLDQRMVELRKIMNVLTDELATLKLMERL